MHTCGVWNVSQVFLIVGEEEVLGQGMAWFYAFVQQCVSSTTLLLRKHCQFQRHNSEGINVILLTVSCSSSRQDRNSTSTALWNEENLDIARKLAGPPLRNRCLPHNTEGKERKRETRGSAVCFHSERFPWAFLVGRKKEKETDTCALRILPSKVWPSVGPATCQICSPPRSGQVRKKINLIE